MTTDYATPPKRRGAFLLLLAIVTSVVFVWVSRTS